MSSLSNSSNSVLSKDPFLQNLQNELASLNHQMENSSSINEQKKMVVSIRNAIKSIDEYIRSKPAASLESSLPSEQQNSPLSQRRPQPYASRDAPRDRRPPMATSSLSSRRTPPSDSESHGSDVITRTMEINIDRILRAAPQETIQDEDELYQANDHMGNAQSSTQRQRVELFDPYRGDQPRPSPHAPKPHAQHGTEYSRERDSYPSATHQQIASHEDSRIEYLTAQLNRTENQLQMLEQQLLGDDTSKSQMRKSLKRRKSMPSAAEQDGHMSHHPLSQSPKRFRKSSESNAHPTSQPVHDSPYKYFKRRITTPVTPFYARSLTPSGSKRRKSPSSSKRRSSKQQQAADLAHYQQALEKFLTPERALSSSYSSATQFLKAMAENPGLQYRVEDIPASVERRASPTRSESANRKSSRNVSSPFRLATTPPENVKYADRGFVSPVRRELDSSFGNRACLQSMNTMRRVYQKQDHSRFLTPEPTPGPADFDPSKALSFLEKHSFSASFGSKTRKTGPTPDYDNPVGPGHYSPNRFWLSSEKNSYRATIGN
eukprot:CAMPEP_0117439160 /NCGR_PEP_ID=MMETSP0759-20121206/2424_1 /TAXON_ID=63605 /ORGANISM="Percolomonas cosmopolitus, Strain WS" /LENGTH=546 /DNA_ID=CAMNT_0005230871 /DNA_START=337 /DNA_END=1974 /DNA_ORIENTATION=-